MKVDKASRERLASIQLTNVPVFVCAVNTNTIQQNNGNGNGHEAGSAREV